MIRFSSEPIARASQRQVAYKLIRLWCCPLGLGGRVVIVASRFGLAEVNHEAQFEELNQSAQK